MRKHACILALSLLTVAVVNAQPQFRFGFSILAGTHVNRVGGFFETSYEADPFVFYNRTALYYAFQSMGPKISGIELQNQTGFNVGWGTEQKRFDTRLVRSPRRNSIGYSYNLYLDQRKTSQVTGTVNMQFDNIMIAVENDIFAHGYFDRYRTGALRIGYVDSNVYAGAQLLLWTGQHNGRRITDSTYPGRHGYMDVQNGKYGQYSSGIASAFVQYRAGRATATAAGGVDAEQIRHLFQNKVLHDMPFLPKRWNKHPNAHIPMVSRDGKPYVYDFGQRVRPVKPYLQLSLNDTGLY
jgi:hypothetical protein